MKLNQRIADLEADTRQPVEKRAAAITARIEELRAAAESKGIVWPEPDKETHQKFEGLRQLLRSQHAHA